ncbi:MAG: phosphate acyltransferase PlsX, partial [Boseongicola sp.]
MTAASEQTKSEGGKRTIISVDAMGGDLGPKAVVAGIKRSADKNPDIGFL